MIANHTAPTVNTAVVAASSHLHPAAWSAGSYFAVTACTSTLQGRVPAVDTWVRVRRPKRWGSRCRQDGVHDGVPECAPGARALQGGMTDTGRSP